MYVFMIVYLLGSSCLSIVSSDEKNTGRYPGQFPDSSDVWMNMYFTTKEPYINKIWKLQKYIVNPKNSENSKYVWISFLVMIVWLLIFIAFTKYVYHKQMGYSEIVKV